MRKLLTVFFFCVVLSMNLVAQDSPTNRDRQHIIDSLKKVIADVEAKCPEPCDADTGRINAYLKLGEQLISYDPDSTLIVEILVKDIAEALLATQPPKIVNRTAHIYLASSLCNIGYIYMNKGDIPKALEYYYKSLTIQEEVEDKQGMAESYGNIGDILYLQGDISMALVYFRKSFKIHDEIGNKQGMANSLMWFGFIYNDHGDIPMVMECFNKSLEISEEIGDKEGMANSFENIGYVYSKLGDMPRSLEYYKKSLVLAEEIGYKAGMAYSFNHIGVIYDNMGDIPKALEYYGKSLKINEELGNKQGLASTFNNLGYIYNNQGNIPKALEYYGKCLKIDEEIGYKKGIAKSLINIGFIYSTQGDTSKAFEYCNKSLNIQEEIGDKHGLAYTFINMGAICQIQGNASKALEYHGESLRIREEINDKRGMAISLVNLGRVNQEQNNLAQLNKYATEGYKISKELGHSIAIGSAAALMMDLCIEQNKYEKADSFAIEVININNKAILSNFETLPESGQEKYFKTVYKNYMDFDSYSLFRKVTNPSIVDVTYNSTIQNKGLLLKSSTAMRNAVLNSEDTTLIDNYYKWIHLKKQIAKKYSNGQVTDSLDNLANNYEKELVKGSKIFSDYKNLTTIKWQDIQKGLKTNEAALEFIHFKYKDYTKENYWEFTDSILYCVLIVTPDSKHAEMIPLFEEKQLQKILSQYSGNNYQYINSIYGKNNEHKGELYNLIWKPLESYLKDVKTVYLSPSGLLHKISFAAIAKDHDVYLCDNYNIEVKSSTGKLAPDSYREPDDFSFAENMTATLYGGIIYNSDSTQHEIWKYLNGTKVETEKIEAILNSGNIENDYYSGSYATEKEFKVIASSSNILHISTHGFFFPDPKEIREAKKEAEDNNNMLAENRSSRSGEYGVGLDLFVKNPNPMWRSGLVLAGANDVWNKGDRKEGEDGVLTAQEVSHIDMRKTDLVVMSACETGLGDIRGSEGVYGLQRAFKMAGVKYMIMSLWQVADKETEEFMTTFYTKLLEIKDVRKAFSETQLEMRQKYDPFFWAAFVLVE